MVTPMVNRLSDTFSGDQKMRLRRSIYIIILLLLANLLLLSLLPGCPAPIPPPRCPPTCPPGQECVDPALGCQPKLCPPTCPEGQECLDPEKGCQPKPSDLPPVGQLVGEDMILRTDGSRLVTVSGRPVHLNEQSQCCKPLVISDPRSIPRPAPLRVKGVEVNTLWPCQSEAAQDYFFINGRSNGYPCRGGPYRVDESSEVDWIEIGGPYLLGPKGEWTPEWNPAFWERKRKIAWHALQSGLYHFEVLVDTWGCSHDQRLGDARHYMLWPLSAIEDCGRRWNPEHERYVAKQVEQLVCFGNLAWELDNEGQGIQGWKTAWFQKMLEVVKQNELKYACRSRIIGTSIPGIPAADYTITHDREPVVSLDGRYALNNERNPAHSPSTDSDYFLQARNKGLGWALWRDGWTDAELTDALARRKAIVDGGDPPLPVTCTLGTPTARGAELRGLHPTIKVQKTTAGYDEEAGSPRAGKWISGTPLANFGRDYYCQPDMNWPEACASPPFPGPVAPEGHPQRPICEAQFLEQPCPTVSQARCTGAGEQCPITFDTYIVIDGVNQLHPSNVAAGCRESTYVKDPAGRLLSGEWWKATAHGKGYIKACNLDGSVCGTSSFEIDY